MKKYKLQRVGYPVAGRNITSDEWKDYSNHSSLWAAIRKMDKCQEHLDYGSWDDHYRVIDPNGNTVNYLEIEMERRQH